MAVEEIRKILAERKRIYFETEDFWDDGIEICWNNLVAILTQDIGECIQFLETEATADEIYWISEVFEDIAAKTHSQEFIAALHRIHDKMPEEVKKSIEIDIESAERSV